MDLRILGFKNRNWAIKKKESRKKNIAKQHRQKTQKNLQQKRKNDVSLMSQIRQNRKTFKQIPFSRQPRPLNEIEIKLLERRKHIEPLASASASASASSSFSSIDIPKPPKKHLKNKQMQMAAIPTQPKVEQNKGFNVGMLKKVKVKANPVSPSSSSSWK